MSVKFNEGRFNVFEGRNLPGSQPIGRIDMDEFVRSNRGELLFRVDGREMYDMNGAFIGPISEGMEPDAFYVTRTDADGVDCLYTIQPE